MSWVINAAHPQVVAARKIAKQCNQSHVIIFMMDDTTDNYTVATYGNSKEKCVVAQRLGEAARGVLVNAWLAENKES